MSEESAADACLVSIIIPAYNEERNLPVLLDSLDMCLEDANLDYNVTVIDNNSTDRTADIARQRGIACISSDASTVSKLRNTGVANTDGKILVFLDADTEVTLRWAKRLPVVLEFLTGNPGTLTGCPYSISDASNWIEKYWFKNLVNNKEYVVGGNMVITRKLFDDINGFDEGLVSGEDYDLSMRAAASGASIAIDSDLEVIHHGNPKTIAHFIRREIWHGKGDFKTVHTIIKSKIAIAALLFLLLHILALSSLITGSYSGFMGYAFLVLVLCALFVIKKFRRTDIAAAAVQVFLCYIYLLSRCLSFISLIQNKFRK